MGVFSAKFSLLLLSLLASCAQKTLKAPQEGAGLSSTASTSLSWDASLWSDVGVEIDPSVKGYKVYYGDRSGHYTSNQDVGDVLVARLSGLPNTRLYFAVKAYNAWNVESPFSNEITADFADKLPINARVFRNLANQESVDSLEEVSSAACLADSKQALVLGTYPSDVDSFSCSWNMDSRVGDWHLAKSSVDEASGLSLNRILIKAQSFYFVVFIHDRKMNINILAPHGGFDKKQSVVAALNTLQNLLPTIEVKP